MYQLHGFRPGTLSSFVMIHIHVHVHIRIQIQIQIQVHHYNGEVLFVKGFMLRDSNYINTLEFQGDSSSYFTCSHQHYHYHYSYSCFYCYRYHYHYNNRYHYIIISSIIITTKYHYYHFYWCKLFHGKFKCISCHIAVQVWSLSLSIN